MRLIYITVTMPFGNAEQFLIPEAFELVRQGQILIIPRSPLGDLVNTDAKGLRNVTVVQPLLSVEIMSTAVCEFVRNPVKSLRALGILLLSRNLKILLKNLAVFPKSLWLSRIARKWGATHIHAHWATTTATMALITNQVSGISWSFTVHRGDITANNLLKLKVQRASFVRIISENGVQMARKILARQLQEKIQVIHMGVALPPFPGNQFVGDNPSVILCPARLLPVKGHTYLLQAISILKKRHINCIVKIAGEGPLEQTLKEQVKALNLYQTVQFLGHIPHEKLLGLYRDGEVDIVVLPSVDLGKGNHEGIPVSLIEAMSYGVPVISTNAGGTPELLRGGAGILVSPKETTSLADAIELLIKDRALRLKLAESGRIRIMEDYSVKETVSKLTEFFRKS